MRILQNAGINVELLEFKNDQHSFLKLLQLPFNLSSYRRTRNKLEQFRPDVVHIHNLHFAGSPSVLYALKRMNVPFVITLHNYRFLCPSATLYNNGQVYLESIKKKFPWDAIKKGVYKNSKALTFWVSLSSKIHQQLGTWQLCSRYIVLTKHAEKIYLESALQLQKSKLSVKPNFCAAPAVVNSHRSDHFLYVGRLTEEKGIPLLLEVFSKCAYKIKIAGDGPLRPVVQHYSKQYPNIEYLDIVNKDDIPSLLSNCTALVFPSIWYEGMPLTIIEAFATSTPVIASRLGAMESMIEHNSNGLHFDANSAEDLKAKLDQWQKMEPFEKESFYHNARNTYEQSYTPEKNLEKLLSIYQSVIDEKNAVAKLPIKPGYLRKLY
jgi:glycosyltransferase involved in cell wall biosynthesis